LSGTFVDSGSFAQRTSFAMMRRFSSAGVSGNFKQGTIMGVVLNTLCNVMGAGILSLPLAMHNASIVVGSMLLLASAIVSSFATYIVACGCDATGKESFSEVLAFSLWPEREYDGRHTGSARRADEIEAGDEEQRCRAEHASEESRKKRLRRYMLVIVELIVFLNNFGALIIYSRVIADSIPPVISNFLGGGGIWTDKMTWFIISGALFFPLTCVRSMEELKWTSLLGFVTILYVVIIVIVRFFTFGPEGRAPSSEVHFTEVSSDVLRSVSAYGVAWGYHYNVPYFYKELRDGTPKVLMQSVVVAFPIILASYASVGILGYIMFGDAIAAHGGDIINNFADDDTAVNVGRLGLFFHFACVFPVLSVCARRGLHRLFMVGLQEAAGSGIMSHIRRLKGAILTERDPLLPQVVSATSMHVQPEHRGEEAGLSETQQRGGDDEEQCLDETLDELQRELEDEDPGRPEDTTRFAIIVEAAVIVTCSVLLAIVVSGIDVVIDIIGTLFGITLMTTFPGIIGMCTFASDIGQNVAPVYGSPGTKKYSYFTSHEGVSTFQQVSPTMSMASRVMIVVGVLLVVSGIVMMCVNS
jgi:amino acid permease